jgi:hypothetical protein
MLRVMEDGQVCVQVTVKPFHLSGLKIVRGGGDMFNYPREIAIIKHSRSEDSRIVGVHIFRHPTAGKIPLCKLADNCNGR